MCPFPEPNPFSRQAYLDRVIARQRREMEREREEIHREYENGQSQKETSHDR